MPRGVKPHRPSRTAERRPRRRAPWAALLALVAAYACLLGLSPVGQAGFLWLHLATEHHDSAVRQTAHRHDGGQAHRHAPAVDGHEADGVHERGEHGHEHSARDDTRRPVSPGAPHEHDGRVHTHDQAPVDDPAVPVGTLSEYYLSPEVKPAPPTGTDAAVPPSATRAPRQAASPVDTPPPRRPG